MLFYDRTGLSYCNSRHIFQMLNWGFLVWLEISLINWVHLLFTNKFIIMYVYFYEFCHVFFEASCDIFSVKSVLLQRDTFEVCWWMVIFIVRLHDFKSFSWKQWLKSAKESKIVKERAFEVLEIQVNVFFFYS